MAYTNEKSYSGELFDLGIPSTNGKFGAMHNIGIMQYGINFPLSKFIKELQLIIESGTDDKSVKRQERLNFLIHCNRNKELQQFFILFCNFINGKDGDGEQWSNYMVITAAGGNIMILFAQLIKDIIDNSVTNSVTNLMSSNKILLEQLSKLTRTPIETIISYIKNHFTRPEMVEILKDIAASEASDCDFKLSPNIIPLIDNVSMDIISNLLQGLEIDPQLGGNAKIGGVLPADSTSSPPDFLFGGPSAYDLRLEKESQSSQSSYEMGESMEEDDKIDNHKFTLAKNLNSIIGRLQTMTISPTDTQAPTDTQEQSIPEMIEILKALKLDDELEKFKAEFIEVIEFIYNNTSITENSGFLLYRVKTLIQIIAGFKPGQQAKEIQKYKSSCDKEQQELYPQIVQQKHLDGVDKKSKCYKYLKYLMEKKEIIKWFTTMAVKEIINFNMKGDYKRSRRDGKKRSTFKPALNKTDALINYIRTITKTTNQYIDGWLIGRWSADNAPGFASKFSAKQLPLSPHSPYIEVCRNFSSLEAIVTRNNGMIPLLCGDIIHFFLNFPTFHTEKILENILSQFNIERTLIGKVPGGRMPPSRIHLVYSPNFSKIDEPLRSSKRILQEKLDDTGEKLGIPNGANLTINTIITTGILEIKDIKDIAREIEFTEEYQKQIMMEEEDYESQSPQIRKRNPTKQTLGGNKYYKKNITLKNITLKNKKMVKNTKYELKNKKIKHKTRKHKSKKHKTRKHKSKKHKM